MPTAPKNQATPVQVDEVLPPAGKDDIFWKDGKRPANFTEWLTWMLDAAIKVPGTKFRFGLDPLLSLLPVFGATAASGVGMWVVIEGIRHRAPISLLIRMAMNQLFNDIGGTVPVIGSLWSAYFKSNSRNLSLLNRWKAGEHAALKKSSRLVLCAFIGVWLGIMALWLFVWFSVAALVWSAFRGIFR